MTEMPNDRKERKTYNSLHGLSLWFGDRDRRLLSFIAVAIFVYASVHGRIIHSEMRERDWRRAAGVGVGGR